MSEQVYLSVIAAAYNEEECVRPLVEEITNAVKDLGESWEIVIVNDGSTDKTGEILRELMGEFPQLRVLDHVRNFGQSAGWESAFREARGKYFATLDADLQNDPAEIPKMLKHLEEVGCDFVNGWRKDRNDPWIRLVSTKIANGFRNWWTNETIHDSACGLKVFKRECVKRVKAFNGMHRFMPTLVKMDGYTVSEIPVNHRARTAGTSKYGISNRLFRGLRDTFAIRWLQSRVVNPEYREMER